MTPLESFTRLAAVKCSREDIIGTRVNRLTVMDVFKSGVANRNIWLVRCKCDCGGEVTTRLDYVRVGHTRSCGCIQLEVRKERFFGATATHRMTNTKTYKAWRAMRGRCLDKGHGCYRNYGGRGISVCNQWAESFEAFLNDMGVAPEGTSLDRINNDGNYEPGNCRWTDAKTQSRNTRRNRMVRAFGETKSVAEWAEDARCTVRQHNILDRLNSGWNAEDAISTPKTLAAEAKHKENSDASNA